MPELILREAQPSDEETVVGLVSELLLELGGQALPSKGTRACAELLSTPERGFVLVAELDSAAVAVCTVSHVHALRSVGRYSIIQGMYVRPERRSTEVGARLLERALEACVARGSAFVELGTPKGGLRQIAFYERSGFFSVGERLRWLPRGP